MAISIEEEIFEVARTMMLYGGSFVANLGEALKRADHINARKIKHTWPEYWEQYKTMAETLKRRAKERAKGGK